MRAAALVVMLAPALLLAQTPRDTASRVAAGTAVISGVVTADDSTHAPVRRAVVTVASAGERGDWRTVTDDQGRFAIGQLPPGHYTISATKAGWLSAYYGSAHPGRPAFGGASLAIKAGEQAPPVTLTLRHGSAITGVVTDAFGRPASGLEMQLAGVRVQDGERRLASQNFTGVQGSVNASTDDRGVYRFYGVAPGDYVIVAMPGFINFGNSEVLQLTPDALTAARRSVAAATPGGASAGVSNGPPQTAARPPTIGATSVFYPGTVDLATATLVRVGPNEERSGLDFVMQLVPTARVQGIVMGPDGQPSAGAFVQLLPPGDDSFMFFEDASTRTGPDGRFELKGVRPGSYQATARASEQTAGGRAGGGLGGAVSTTMIDNGNIIMFNSGPGPNGVLWASEAVTVAGQDIPSLTLTLQRGTTVSGRVLFTGTSLQAPQDVSRIRVMLLPAAGNARMGGGQMNAQTDASGVFHVANVPPGRYRVNVVVLGPGRGGPGGGGRGGGGAGPLQMAGAPAASWQLKSVMSGDVDAIDHPIDVTQNAAPADLVVTFTDRLGEISGAVKNGAGQPVSDYRIVVFSADKTVWGTASRRMRAPVQTERDGTFRVENLPAGNYFLAAVTDMEPEDLTDMAFLDDLAKQAIPISPGDGEKKVQEIRVK